MPCVREVSFQSRVGVCTVDKVPVPTVEIHLASCNNVLTNAGIHQLNVLCSDPYDCSAHCPGAGSNVGECNIHSANCMSNNNSNNNITMQK